jgi:tetratricopeptide (TPR) repeat protein
VQFRTIKRTPRTFAIPLLLLALTASAVAAGGLVVPAAPPQSDPDALYNQAVQDFTQNRFSDASAKFEKVQGPHAQEAKQYLGKIKAYKDAVGVAKAIMDRSPDERDASSLEYAIQKYQEAIKIKPDGPWHPAEELEKAKSLKTQVEQAHKSSTKAMDRAFCEKALGAAAEHHYKEAAQYSCPLANDDPAYSCGGDEAVHMCQQMTELASELNTGTVAKRQPAQPDNGLDNAKAAYDKNDFERAKAQFQRVSGDLKSAADEYLGKISRYQDAMALGINLSRESKYAEAREAFQNAANIKADGPGDPKNQALLMELMEGMDQFYSGDYTSATQHLEAYARESTDRRPLAHFYLGASKLAKFFLTGSEDASLRQDALNDLKVAKQSGFKITGQDVSPKILQAYKDLSF